MDLLEYLQEYGKRAEAAEKEVTARGGRVVYFIPKEGGGRFMVEREGLLMEPEAV